MVRFQVVRELWVHGDGDAAEVVAERATEAEATAWMRDPANQWRRKAGSAHEGATDTVVAVTVPGSKGGDASL